MFTNKKKKKVIYICNFASFFVQIPALYGTDGLLPIKVKKNNNIYI
jgi:hypothetical protein